MSFGAAVRSVLSQYATFTGRARRSEYWWFSLAYGLVFTVLYVLGLALLIPGSTTAEDGSTELGPTGPVGIAVLALLGLLYLALLVPGIALVVRRLHDTGRSGWWYLVSFVPFGSIVLLVFMVMDSVPGPNEHGPNPKGVGGAGYGYGAPQAYGTPQGYGAPQAYGTPSPYGDPQGYGAPQQPGAGQGYGAAPDPRFGTPPQG